MTEDIEHSKQQITDEVCSDCKMCSSTGQQLLRLVLHLSVTITHIVGLNMHVHTSAIASLDRFGLLVVYRLKIQLKESVLLIKLIILIKKPSLPSNAAPRH